VSNLRRIAIEVATALRGTATAATEWADALEDATFTGALPFIDRTAEMPVNLRPFHRDFVRAFPGRDMWPMRGPDDATGITIHHTLSHSPAATARYCTQAKGYPTVQYHYWVSADDGCPVYLLADPALALWHDHTGAHPTTLSVGMAGSLHLAQPPREQIEALVRLVAWLIKAHDVPIAQVQGHVDRFSGTVCPGWGQTGWRDAFYGALAIAIATGA
jgi:hypothetical protein